MRNFLTLTQDEQAQAIRRLARAGMSDHGIVSATRLSVEMVRKILGNSKTQPKEISMKQPTNTFAVGDQVTRCQRAT